jgi:hypothetical protein
LGFEVQRVDSLRGSLEVPLAAAARLVGQILRPIRSALRSMAGQLEACGVPAFALLALPVLNMLITMVWLPFSQLSPKLGDVAMALAIFGGLAGLAILASRSDKARPVAAVAGTIAVIFGGFASVSFPSALGTAMSTTLWDGPFLRFDRLLGVDHAAFYDWLVGVPYAVDAMSFCYGLTVLIVLLTGIVVVMLGRYERLGEFNVMFASTLTIVVLVSAMMPAAGLFTEVRFTAAVLQALPDGAGTYHLDLFYALRAGTPMAYGPFDNPGLIVFPSFHTCMALLVLYALRDDPVLKWPAAIYCAITVVATVPYGSHYVADLAGGAAIFAACAWAVRVRAAELREATPRLAVVAAQ